MAKAAELAGMKSASSYQNYEDRPRETMPVWLIERLIPAFTAGGVDEDELVALAGSQRLLNAIEQANSDKNERQIDSRRLETLMYHVFGDGMVIEIRSNRVGDPAAYDRLLRLATFHRDLDHGVDTFAPVERSSDG